MLTRLADPRIGGRACIGRLARAVMAAASAAKRSICLGAALCTGMSALATAELDWPAGAGDSAGPSLRLNGAIRSQYFRSSKALDERTDLVGLGVLLQGSARFDGALAKFDARIGDASLAASGEGYAELIQATVRWQQRQWDWRVGKQVVAWGRADGINPTDVLTPRDYTVLLPFDEDQRTGVWSLVGDYAWTPDLSVTVFMSPDFEPSTLALPPALRALAQSARPAFGEAAQFALKLNRAGPGLDWSLSAYRGRNLLPQAQVGSGATSASGLQLSYPMITMLGSDMARNWGDYGTRLEWAYVNPSGVDAPQRPGLRPYLFMVLGVDRTFYSNLNINLQWLLRRCWGRPPPAWAATEADAFNAAAFVQHAQTVTGVSMRLAHHWLNQTLHAEVYMQRYVGAADLYLQPMLTYAVSDAVRASLGGQIYSGEGPQFGAMKRNRNWFAELRYSF